VQISFASEYAPKLNWELTKYAWIFAHQFVEYVHIPGAAEVFEDVVKSIFL